MRTIGRLATCLALILQSSLCESGETDFGPLANFIEPPVIVPQFPTVDDVVRVRIAFGNCVLLQEPQEPGDISVQGNVVTVIVNRFTSANPNCGTSGDRIEGEVEIGLLPKGSYEFDLLGRNSVGVSPLYSGIRFGVSDPVSIPTLQREMAILLSLLLMIVGVRRLAT